MQIKTIVVPTDFRSTPNRFTWALSFAMDHSENRTRSCQPAHIVLRVSRDDLCDRLQSCKKS
jgi:hypothetical protein